MQKINPKKLTFLEKTLFLMTMKHKRWVQKYLGGTRNVLQFCMVLTTLGIPENFLGWVVQSQVKFNPGLTGLSKRFRVAGDCKKVGGPTKHETHFTLIAASIILISFFTAGRHDFLFSTCMNWRDDIFYKCTK